MNKLEQTMSSVELVKTINAIREEEGNTSELRHDNFMDKVVKVLGEGALNFQGSYLSTQNKELPCYYLPKREATLLAMSESYKVQATIYDRMTELEQQAQKQLPQSHIEAVRAYLTTLEKVEEQQSQIKQQIETISNQSVVISDKKVLTNDSEEYFTVNRVKELNPDMVFSGVKLTAKSNELELPTTQLFAPYNMNVPNTYHSKVWNLVYPKAKLP